MSEVATALSRLKGAQKSSDGAAAYSRFVNRPVGRRLAALAYVAGLTPNQVTALAGVSTFAGIAAIAVFDPSVSSSLLVSALLVLGYALDSADGQLARLTGAGSLAGEWLDHILDAAKTATLHVAVLVCWVRFYAVPLPWLSVPVVYGSVASVFFFGVIATDLLRRIHRLGHPVAPESPESPSPAWRSNPLYSLVVLPTDYGFLCLSFLLLWWHPGFMVVYTALAAANLVVLPLAAWRWYRSLKSLDRSDA